MPTCIQEISPEVGVQAQYFFPGGSNSFRGGGGGGGVGRGVQLLFYKEKCGFSRVGGPDLTPSPPSGPAHNLYTCVSV